MEVEPSNTSIIVPTLPKALLKPSLNSLESCHAITREGKNWFIEATDPFHDDRIDLSGYPDTNVSGSIIQCVKQSKQLSAPSGAPANWDAQIVMWPNPVQEASALYKQDAPGAYEQATTGLFIYATGGVTALGVASGFETYGSASTVSHLADIAGVGGTFGLPATYLNGNARVIGMGFEVTNTTSELNVQGQVTVWRQPVPPPTNLNSAYIAQAGGGNWGTPDEYHIRQPPGTLADTMLLEGSATWKAKDGCYVVATMNSEDNHSKLPTPVMVTCGTQDTLDLDDSVDTVVGSQLVTTNLGTNVILWPETRHVAPFNMCGAYFTGLSNTSTLQLTAVWYVERFPTPSETDLVVLASPSAAYDPAALQMYAETISKLPVGVPQGMNPLGEWFKSVLNKVSKYATPVLRALEPVLPGAGAAAVISKAVHKATNSNAENRKRAEQKRKRQGKQQSAMVRRKVGTKPLPPLPKKAAS